MSVGIFCAFSGAEFVRFAIQFAQNFALFGMFSVRDACASSANHAQGVVASVPQHLKQFCGSFLIVRRVAVTCAPTTRAKINENRAIFDRIRRNCRVRHARSECKMDSEATDVL